MTTVVRTARRTVVVPTSPVGAPGAKGDPGGNVMAVGLLSALALSLTTIPSGTDLIQTSGAATAGKGHSLLIHDAVVDSSWTAAHPGAGFVDAAGRGFRLSLEQPLTPKMFAAVADGTGFDTTAFANLQNYQRWAKISDFGDYNGYAEGLTKIVIPLGIYAQSGPLDIYSGIFEGVNGSKFAAAASVLTFPQNSSGLRLQFHNAADDETFDAGQTRYGAGSIVRNLHLKSSNTGSDTTHMGVRIKQPSYLADLFIDGFAGNGVHAHTQLGGSLGIIGNAATSVVARCTVQNCATGYHFQGADASGFLLIGDSAIGNRGYGFVDATEFGGVIIAGHAEANTLGNYYTDPAQSAANPLLLGCYSESGGPACTFSSTTLRVGGGWNPGDTGGGWVRAAADAVHVNALGCDGNITAQGIQFDFGPQSGTPSDSLLQLINTNVTSQIAFVRSGNAPDATIQSTTNSLYINAVTVQHWRIAGNDIAQLVAGGIDLQSGKVLSIAGTTVLSGQMAHIANLSAAPTAADINGLLAALQGVHLMA